MGEEGLAESIHRLGDIDFFSVITRKPRICDYKSVVVEVAIARLKDTKKEEEETVQLLRFANRVPLQFDKASCAITKAVESVNWRAYGLSQSKKTLPTGPFVFAIAVTSPFIKFKNASKETIDASEELVEEIRLALMQAGQKLKKHIRKEKNTADLLRKKEYIEKFAPILIRKIKDISKASSTEINKGEKGLYAILSKDAKEAEKALGEAQLELEEMKAKRQGAFRFSHSQEKSNEGKNEQEGENTERKENKPGENLSGKVKKENIKKLKGKQGESLPEKTKRGELKKLKNKKTSVQKNL